MKTVYACVNVCVCEREKEYVCMECSEQERGGEKCVERNRVENWQTETLQYILTDDTQIIRLASPTAGTMVELPRIAETGRDRGPRVGTLSSHPPHSL